MSTTPPRPSSDSAQPPSTPTRPPSATTNSTGSFVPPDVYPDSLLRLLKKAWAWTQRTWGNPQPSPQREFMPIPQSPEGNATSDDTTSPRSEGAVARIEGSSEGSPLSPGQGSTPRLPVSPTASLLSRDREKTLTFPVLEETPTGEPPAPSAATLARMAAVLRSSAGSDGREPPAAAAAAAEEEEPSAPPLPLDQMGPLTSVGSVAREVLFQDPDAKPF